MCSILSVYYPSSRWIIFCRSFVTLHCSCEENTNLSSLSCFIFHIPSKAMEPISYRYLCALVIFADREENFVCIAGYACVVDFYPVPVSRVHNHYNTIDSCSYVYDVCYYVLHDHGYIHLIFFSAVLRRSSRAVCIYDILLLAIERTLLHTYICDLFIRIAKESPVWE